ncbi:MAG: glutathione S-transferase family protein [Pseudomonadales bacterium]
MSRMTLYGSPLSLYTGRARSYLIKAGIDYREIIPTSRHYIDIVLPKAGGRASVPTIETPTGDVIRDGVAIVDQLEEVGGPQFSPMTPKQRIISRLMDVIGAEGLLRPAMHYRWNFPEQNLNFLRFHFRTMMPPGPDREKKGDKAADRMRAACMAFGAVPETFELVEALYQELIEKFDSHFADHPYLLGGKPCVGDFGLIAPFYGHLGRDPKPLSLMQAQAIRLFRWVERMNRPEPDVGEFEDQDGNYLPNDEVPETLIDVLKQIAIDFVPETQAAAACINEWIDAQDSLPPGSEVPRGVGLGSFKVRGLEINALAQPFRFYLLKRVQDEFAALGENNRKEVAEMLSSCDMNSVLDINLTREIGRKNNLEVWL